MEPLKGLPPEMLSYLLLQMSVILGIAYLLGELMRRCKQPAVIGNLLAGIFLGPSVLGHWFPAVQLAIFPHDQHQADLLSGVTWLGLLLLLFLTGIETDLDLIRGKGGLPYWASGGGIILPFISGFVLGHYLPQSVLADPKGRLAFSLFLAVAMCISALPVIAIVLRDLQMIRRDVGQVTLAAAMMDDTVGWILLSVVSGLIASGRFNALFAARMVGIAVVFLVVSFVAVGPVVRRIVTWSDNLSPGPGAQLAVLIFLALLFGAFTDWIGLEAVLGVFVMGILVGQVRRLRIDAVHSLDLIVSWFLAPIYFGLAGLRVDLWSLFHWNTLLIMLAVMAVACFGKCVGVYCGAWVGGASHWERLAMGLGMNARGAMEIVVATVGLTMGVFNFQIYSVVVVMAVATALLAGPTMRWALAHVGLSRAESERLESEQATAKSFIRRLRRVLLPTWAGADVQEGARLIALLNKGQAVEATALSVGSDASESAFQSLEGLHPGGPDFNKMVVPAKDSASTILAESHKAYDLILLEASERSGGTMDAVMRSSPCPTLVVRSAKAASAEIKNMLVYTDGGKACGHAVELAGRLAAAAGAKLTVLYVADLLEGLDMQTDAYEARQRLTQEIVDAHADLARKLDATVDAVVVEAVRPDAGILLEALDTESDLIVLTGSAMPTTGRPFLGSLVTNVFREATCTVAVLNA